jgi:phosphoribosylglycinamide formyltransferase-1
MIRLGFLASHRGSNMQSVIDACHDGRIRATPAVIISNNRTSGALVRAADAGIPRRCLNSTTHPDPDRLDTAILSTLQAHRVDLIILAGYMKKIGPRTLAAYRGRIINIHPALLPKYGGRGMFGLHVHAAVLAAGERETGVTVHLVDEEYDHGPILVQRAVPVLRDDTPESLAERVLQVEHEVLVETVGKIVDGTIPLLG